MNKIILTALILLTPGSAFAYFDAGTGALLMQGLVGAVTFVVVFWGKLKLYIQSFFSRDQDASPSVDAEETEQSDEQTTADVDAKDRL